MLRVYVGQRRVYNSMLMAGLGCMNVMYTIMQGLGSRACVRFVT